MQHQIRALANSNPDGQFVVFEGPDKSGKTTLIKAVAAVLEADRPGLVVTQREPGGTEMGEELRVVLTSQRAEHVCPETDIMLHMAQRRQNVFNTVIPGMAAGKTVLTDRFTLSTYAYNLVPYLGPGAMQNDPLHILFLGLMQVAIEGLVFEPTTFIVKTPVAIRRERIAEHATEKRHRYENFSQEHLDLIDQTYERYEAAPNTVVIDGLLPLDEQVQIVLATLVKVREQQHAQIQKAIEAVAQYDAQIAEEGSDGAAPEDVPDEFADAEAVPAEPEPSDEEKFEQYMTAVMDPGIYADNERHAERMVAGKDVLRRMLVKTFDIVPMADFLKDGRQREEFAQRFRSMEYYKAMHEDTLLNLERPVEELKAEAAARTASAMEQAGLREASPEEVAVARTQSQAE